MISYSNRPVSLDNTEVNTTGALLFRAPIRQRSTFAQTFTMTRLLQRCYRGVGLPKRLTLADVLESGTIIRERT